MTHGLRWTTLALSIVLVSAGPAPTAAQATLPASFEALAISPGAGPGQSNLQVQILVTRLSTPEERAKLSTAMSEQGADRFLQVLKDMPAVGSIRGLQSLAYDFRYASMSEAGGTQRFTMLTDRPVAISEVSNRESSLGYQVTVMELRVPPSGEGEGNVVTAARPVLDRVTKAMSFQNYGFSTVLLRGLKREKP